MLVLDRKCLREFSAFIFYGKPPIIYLCFYVCIVIVLSIILYTLCLYVLCYIKIVLFSKCIKGSRRAKRDGFIPAEACVSVARFCELTIRSVYGSRTG